MIGRLDHFGLHVSMEPFENEVVLINEYSLPSRSMLEQSLNQMFEFSDYSDELCFLEIIWFLIYEAERHRPAPPAFLPKK